MCGRYTLNTTGQEIARQFELKTPPEFEPRFNVAPTQNLPVVRVPEIGAHREAPLLRWGLVPFWADDTKIGNRMINARSETVPEKPAFRAAFARRRCVIPASGFFEWKKTDDGKQPWYFHHADDELLGFAGIWERWSDEESGEVVESYAILTGEPNEVVEDAHGRMPVTLLPEDYSFWMDPAIKDQDALHKLVQQVFPAELMGSHPVSTRVNSPANDDASILEPIET